MNQFIRGQRQQEQGEGTPSKDAPVARPPPGWLLSVTRDLAKNDSWMIYLVGKYL